MKVLCFYSTVSEQHYNPHYKFECLSHLSHFSSGTCYLLTYTQPTFYLRLLNRNPSQKPISKSTRKSQSQTNNPASTCRAPLKTGVSHREDQVSTATSATDQPWFLPREFARIPSLLPHSLPSPSKPDLSASASISATSTRSNTKDDDSKSSEFREDSTRFNRRDNATTSSQQSVLRDDATGFSNPKHDESTSSKLRDSHS